MLIDKIQTDLIKALKGHEAERLEALRFLKSQIKNFEIDKGETVSDDDVLNLIRKQLRILSEDLEQFQQAGRSDLVDKNYFQMQILSSYLPPEISDEDLEAEIKKFVAEKSDQAFSNPNAMLGICIEKLKSKASSQRIVASVRKILSF